MNTASNQKYSSSAFRQSSDDALQSAGNAVDLTRDYANDALSKAESKIRNMRESVDPVVDMLATKAQQLARQSLDMANEAKERAQQSITRAAGVTTRYVAEQPLRSVLIAGAVGAAVALLIAATSRHNKDLY